MPSNHVQLELRYSSTKITPEFLLQPARKFMPTWYEQIPKKGLVMARNPAGEEYSVNTVRSCPGIVHIMARGFIAPMPFDMAIRVTRDSYDIKVPQCFEGLVDVHDPAQLNFATAGNHIVVKVGLPYSVRSDKLTEFMYFNPVMHNIGSLDQLHVPSGIINFRDQYSLSAFVVVPLATDSEPKDYAIKVGTPLIQLVPLSEQRVTLQHTETESWAAPPSTTFFTSFIEKAKYMRRIRGD